MPDSSVKQTRYNVICICGGYGFPLGNASAARITIVGKTLLQEGINFSLLHCGPSPSSINNQKSGVYEGIPFEYTTSVRRPQNWFARVLVYVWALVGLTIRLARSSNRSNTLVYLYVSDSPLNLYAGCLCRLLGIPVVQELCEWLPSEPTCSAFNRWLHKKPIFKLATGALVISKAIEERVRKRSRELNVPLLVHRLPSIVDAKRFADATPTSDGVAERIPHFAYCGSWLKDVFFVLRALAVVKHRGYECKLAIIGEWAESRRDAILQQARENGLSDNVVLTGVLDERALEASYKAAAGLLAPLWDDDRSKTRLPNKISEYLASGRPVIACKVGDLTDFLVDNVNAFLAEPGDETDFAEKMIALLSDPDRAEQIGAAGQQACMAYLDYRAHIPQLTKFFLACVNQRTSWSHPVSRSRNQIKSFLRNVFCESLALGIIASGRMGRAKRKALSTNVITSIYFHNPNRRLFGRCVQWLIRNGYTFISANDLVEIFYRGKAIPKGAVWLSLDDGYKEWIDDVLPLVRQRQLPVTLFIPSGIVENGGQFPWLHEDVSAAPAARQAPPHSDRDAVTVQELKTIAGYPEVTIGAHTVNHTVVLNLPEERATFELRESKRVLESWTGATVHCFAYPMGLHSGQERSLLKECGYKLAATTESKFVTGKTDPYFLPRFTVSDRISFPEAICNMVGVWQPALAPVKKFLRRNTPAL